MKDYAPRGAYERGRQDEHSNNNNGDNMRNAYIACGNIERRQKMTFEERDQLTAAEQKFVDMLKGKSPAEQEQILIELERNLRNGDNLRNDSTGNRTL